MKRIDWKALLKSLAIVLGIFGAIFGVAYLSERHTILFFSIIAIIVIVLCYNTIKEDGEN